MKKEKKIFVVLLLFPILLVLAALCIFWYVYSSYPALKSLSQCSFTMEYRLLGASGKNPILNAAGIHRKGVLKGQCYNGAVHAKVYPDKNSGSDLITEIYAGQDGGVINIGPIAKRLSDYVNKKIKLPFSCSGAGNGLYISIDQLEKFFPDAAAIFENPVTELNEKKTFMQFRRCSAPDNTILPCSGYHFYKYKNGNIFAGLKRQEQKKGSYSIFLYVPGKVESIIDYAYESSPKDIVIPEPSVPDSVFSLLEYVF